MAVAIFSVASTKYASFLDFRVLLAFRTCGNHNIYNVNMYVTTLKCNTHWEINKRKLQNNYFNHQSDKHKYLMQDLSVSKLHL